MAAVAAAEAAEAAAAAADASDAAAAVAAADAADAAEAKKQGGFFGKMFGKKKEKERPNATPPAAAPPAPAPVPTTVDGCVQALAGSGDAAQKRQAAEKLRELCASSTAELAEGDRPLVLVEALGGAADPPMQATLCMLLAQLAGGAADGALAGRLADGGALFYLASLLASPSAEVAQEATLLLTAMCATSEAVRTQLVDVANGLPPLLALLSNASPPLPSLVLALLDSLVAAGAARALRDAGAAEPLARSLVAAASEAKGWGGGGATGEGEARAATLLGILDAMADVDVQAVQDGMRAASATPSLVALLGAADEGLRGKASGMLNRLVPADGAGSGEMVASGGLVMLCDALANGTSEANRKQALQTVAKLSSSAQNAVAIAENAGTVGALHHFLGDADGAAASAALATLANLTVVGALKPDAHSSSPEALSTLAARLRAADASLTQTQRVAVLSILCAAALDPRGRQLLASLGVPPLFADALTPGGAIEPLPEAKRQATQALAHFAADEATRPQLGSWGALPPLAAQLSASVQPDGRVRACALSALANISFVDAPALVGAGVLGRLPEALFESDAPTLRMALATLLNLLPAADAATAAPLAQACAAHAVAALLGHADAELRAQAVGAAAAMSAHPPLAAALAEAGAAATLATLLRSGADPAAALALGTLAEASDAARAAALRGGRRPLARRRAARQRRRRRSRRGRAHAGVARARRVGAGVRRGGVAGAPLHPAARRRDGGDGAAPAHAARGASNLLLTEANRLSLVADPRAVHFLARALGSLSAQAQQGAPSDRALALGTAHAYALLLRSSAPELVAEAVAAIASMGAQASALAEAGVPAALALLKSDDPLVAAGAARAPRRPRRRRGARAAARASGAVDALAAALTACADGERKMTLALTLASLLRGGHPTGVDWPAIVAALATAAGAASAPMKQLADAVAPALTDALAAPKPAAPAPTREPSSPFAAQPPRGRRSGRWRRTSIDVCRSSIVHVVFDESYADIAESARRSSAASAAPSRSSCTSARWTNSCSARACATSARSCRSCSRSLRSSAAGAFAACGCCCSWSARRSLADSAK